MTDLPRNPKVLVVDDDPRLRDLLRRYLGENDFSVTVADGGQSMKRIWMRERFDALILDLMMPGEDGLQILRRLRAAKDTTPIIMLTARGEDVDRIVGLELGADDYLPKPFAMSEFLARVRALLRRSESYTPRILTFGNVTLDCGQYTLSTVPSTETVRLNNKEFQLMELFMRHPRQVFPAERLMELVWGLDAAAEIDVVWTYIGFLRKKCRAVHADIAIQTIRGAGYALTEVDNHAS